MATRKWKSEFLVNTSTAGNQTGAVVTALQDGGFVIAWLDDDPAVHIIRFQRFDALGNMVGGEASHNQFFPAKNDTGLAITTLSDGRFSIVGGEEFGPGDNDLKQTIYNADGTVGNAVNIASSGDDEIEQSVAALAGGAQVVVYTDLGSNSGDVRFSILSNLNAYGTSGIVNTNVGTLATLQNQPQVAANAAGDKFAVVWADSGLNVGDIRLAVYNYDSGTNTAFLFNGEIGINSIADDVQFAPDVAFLDNTRVVVAWQTEVGINTHGDGSV